MTKKPRSGTLSTRGSSDKKIKPSKETNVIRKMKSLLGLNKVRFSGHANERMGQRNVIDYEIRQALSNGRHDASRDRFSSQFKSWEYSIDGKTQDDRLLRIGISFETDQNNGERLLVVTVIEPGK